MKLLLALLLLPFLSYAQTAESTRPFPQQQINEAIQKAWLERDNPIPVANTRGKAANAGQLGIYHYLQGQGAGARGRQTSIAKSLGDLYVGTTPNDTLIVTGAWQNDGNVFVVNNGVLIFDSAQASISGFLLVGGTGKIIATNSSFFFPQQYFYEWGLQAVENGQMYMRHCSLDFNNMSRTIAVSDSGTIIQQNVHFADGSTTTGLNGHGTYIVDTANLLGEIVATDTINLQLQNVDTVIVWHHVGRGQGLTCTFPNGYGLQHYGLGPDSAGVTGLQYSIELDNIAQVHWAVMPENESVVNISNSTVRSVAVIFRGTDNAAVQGLVDNSTYTTSPTFFTDRTFTLDSCSLETWGIYPTDTTHVSISSCITGEIGTSGVAETSCSSSFSDGTGGYFWANGKGFQAASGCGFKCAVRAEQGSTVLVGFSSIAAATGFAIDSGLLIMIQTPVVSPPIAYDGSDIWVGMLTPQTADSGYVVPLTGSAYILRGPTSNLMSFASYYVAYQAPGDTNWVTIDSVFTTAVNTGTLVNWNTTGLVTGSYNLILVIKDNHGDSVTVPSAINLVIGVPAGIANVGDGDLRVYPNPSSTGSWQLAVGDELIGARYEVYDATGQLVFKSEIRNPQSEIALPGAASGVYELRVVTGEGMVVRRLVKL